MFNSLCFIMWNEPSNEALWKLPKLHETDNIPLEDKIIHMHFFLYGSHWYIAEYNPEQSILFAYTILNYDLHCGKWDHVTYDELRSRKTEKGWEVERDLYWIPQRASSVEQIQTF